MSAVIVEFPRNARAISERRRAVKNAVGERADFTHATIEQRRRAMSAAISELERGGSAGWAIQLGYYELPRVQRHAFRMPTDPRPAA